MAPYILLHRKPASAAQAVVLDYVSPIAPVTIYQAIRQRDALVTLASVSSLLVTLLIVVSTGLLGLIAFPVARTGLSMTVSDSIVHKAPSLSTSNVQMPFYIFDAIHNLTLKYPPGTTASFAYQSFNLTNPSAADTLTAEVDGFSGNLKCEPAVLHFGGLSRGTNIGGGYGTHGAPDVIVSNVSISADGCEADVTPPTAGVQVGDTFTYGRFIKVSCNGAGDGEGSQRILIYAMELSVNSTSSDNSTMTYDYSISHSTQLLCRPSYNLSRLHVTVDHLTGTNIAATTMDESPETINPTIEGLSAWSLTDLILSSVSLLYQYDSQPGADWDQVFNLARQARPDLSDKDMFDFSSLQALFTSFYASVTAQIAKELLMDPSQSTILGSSFTSRTRLVVRPLSARIMEATLAVLAIIALIMAVFCPRRYSVPCDPGSLAGSAAVLSLNEELVKLSGHPLYPEHITPGYESWLPLVLKPIYRSAGLCVIVAVVVVLESLLQVSQKHNGITNINLDQYIHYTWSYIPAFVMVVIKLFASSIDFNTRLLAPFSRLKQQGTYRNALSINYLRQLAPSALVSSVRARQFAVTATTLMALIGSVLTVVVSGVYDTAQTPTESSVELQRQDSFRSVENIELDNTVNDKGGMLGALLLEEGLSYPRWTYDELAFPSLEIVRDSEDIALGSYIDTTVPALRTNLQCRYLSGLQQVNATVDWTSGGELNVVKPPALASYVNTQSDVYIGATGTVSPDAVFGATTWAGDGNGLADPPEYAYIWGSLKGREIDNIVILMCDENIHSVDVSVRFSLPDFSIDGSHPPTPLENSTKWFTDLFITEPYGQLPSGEGGPFPQDQFFTLLVKGKGGIQAADLRNSSSIDKVVDTIKRFHGIMRAQQYSIILRQPPSAIETVASRQYSSAMTSNTRSRLIQHAVSTRILEAMLLAMLVLGIAATFMMRTRDILLENPCSIAAMGRLLADSDILDRRSESFSPDGFPIQGPAKATSSQGQLFRLGWFERMWQRMTGLAPDGQHPEPIEHPPTGSEKNMKVFTIRALDPLEQQRQNRGDLFEETGTSTKMSGNYTMITRDEVDASLQPGDWEQQRTEGHAIPIARTKRRWPTGFGTETRGRDSRNPAETHNLVTRRD